MPEAKNCLQAYLINQNAAQAQLIRQNYRLTQDFTDIEKQIIKNLDISNILPLHFEASPKYNRKQARPEIRLMGWCLFADGEFPIQFQFIDVSRRGFQINIKDSERKCFIGEELALILQFNGELLQCKARIRWMKWETRLGCSIHDASSEWQNFVDYILHELSGSKVTLLQKVG